MQSIENGKPIENGKFAGSLLRFVFTDTVVSCALAADATLGDVARAMVKVSKQRSRTPVAIYMTLSRASRPSHLN